MTKMVVTALASEVIDSRYTLFFARALSFILGLFLFAKTLNELGFFYF